MWSAALTLFLVLDSVGNIPAWLAVLDRVPPRRRTRVVLRECAIALAVLVGFQFAGPALLRLLGVEGPALSVAAGVVLFLIALRMIFPHPTGVFGEIDPGDSPDSPADPLVVPLAVPLLAGPSALATISLLAGAKDLGATRLLAALGIAWAASLAVLISAPLIGRALGRRGVTAVARLMGMLLTVVAVQLVMTGLRAYLAAG